MGGFMSVQNDEDLDMFCNCTRFLAPWPHLFASFRHAMLSQSFFAIDVDYRTITFNVTRRWARKRSREWGVLEPSFPSEAEDNKGETIVQKKREKKKVKYE